MISGTRPDRLLKVSFAFLWLALLLFPVAHLAIGGGIPMYWSELAIGCSCLAFILHDPGQIKEKLSLIFREEFRFFLSVGFFLAGIVLAYSFNPHSFSGWGEIKSFYIIPVFFLIIILVHAETRERIESLMSGWLLGLAAASFAGAVAYMSGWLSYDGRLSSLYLSPNYFAMLLAPGLLIVSYFFATQPEYRHRLSMFLFGITILFALWATRSYAAWIAILTAFVGGVFLWRVGEPRRYAPLFLVAAIILGGVVFQERGTEKWQSLVSGDERSSFASRIMIWQVAMKMVQDSFPIGIGTGRFQEVYLENQANFPAYLEWAVPTPHNLYLHFLLEGGVLALFGWLGCILIVVQRSIRSLRRDSGNRLLVLGLALVIFYLAYGLVDTPYMKNDLVLAVWGSLGFCLGALRARA